MKKYIPLFLALSVFAGCSDTAPASQPDINTVTYLGAEPVDPITVPETTVPYEVTSSEPETSADVSLNAEKIPAAPAETSAVQAVTELQKVQPLQSDADVTEPPVTDVPEEDASQAETVVTYENGSPRFNNPDAVKDIEISETRCYIYTDDKGENGCAPGVVTYFAKIPVGDDMPEYIEFIDIDTDVHVGYMYDDGNTEVSGDKAAGDGIYSIKITYDLDIDTDPDVSETWSRCYFALYNDSQGVDHTSLLPSFVEVREPVTEKEKEAWDVVQKRISAITSSSEYESADTDEKQEMLLRELDLLADEGLVYEHLTRTNDSPRNVVFKIVKGPTMIIELESCSCGYGHDDECYDDGGEIKDQYYDLLG